MRPDMKSKMLASDKGRMARHLEAVNELEDCTRSIRQLPEHRRFPLGPTPEELKHWACRGCQVD
jgi:hypothetical protein